MLLDHGYPLQKALEEVRNENSDEFGEVNHILDRYKVLKES
jgi:hypothetical protein